ncbi:hypothetical protein HHI36_006604 [Cryptolaemus montrouzieri]|uniref:Uncharacterized protein n=1 Tax=Cryptolaemus montrouzieri TaxID=559131 RepID=A0ABD2NYY5_9CUCU
MEIKSVKDHPRISANFLSVIFYCFTFETFKRGCRNEWQPNNIYNTITSYRSQILGDEIERRWNEEKQNSAKRNAVPSLLRIILRMFWYELVIAVILLSISQIVMRLAEPILLGQLLKYFKDENSISKMDAFCYGLYIAGVIGIRIIFYNQYKARTYKSVLKIRVACTTLIYRKVLNLTLTSIQQTTTGQIMNYISYDLNRLEFGTDLIHFVWVAPIFVLSIIYILYMETGLSGLVGVLWFSFLAIIQSYNGNLTATIYRRMNSKTSNRLRIMNEIISGIQVIKMYAWEQSFAKLVDDARKEELNAVTKLNYVRNLFMSFSTISNHLALFFTLFVIISMGDSITSAKFYGLVVYYGVLNFIVSIMFILAISKCVEIWGTIKRLNEFLLMEEFLQNSNADLSTNTIVQLDDVEARWNSSNSLCNNNKKPHYKKITFDENNKDMEKEQLMNKVPSIVGPVGSGKSSLLQTILGELELTSGTIKVDTSVSYASQDSWTFGGTVKDNILFGQEFDADRYREVVRVCCLERDFELLTNGDSTIVGDRGASLSGGQKSRINLARAVYRERNIYLLDDPLSAVDMQVAKHIYKECIEEFLKNKCRILVTHHIHHLRTSDYIIVLNQGTIQDSGTYNDLICRSNIFSNRGLPLPKNHDTSAEIDETIAEEATDIIDDLTESTPDQQPQVNQDKEDCDLKNPEITIEETKKFILLKYFFKDMNWWYFMMILFLFLFIQVLLSSTDLFLSGWVNVEEHKNSSNGLQILKRFHMPFPSLHSSHYLNIYGGLILIIALCNLIRSATYVDFFRSNSKKLHNNIFSKVMHASMEFFDCTSSGKILNRFSREMQVADEFIPRTIMEALMFVNSLLAAMVIVLLLNPYVLVMVAIMSITFILISYFYMKTSKNIKEVESSLMSPILSHLNETIQGLITIRGLSAQHVAKKKFNQYLDRYASSWYMLATAFSAFGFYIEFICYLFISVVTLSLIAIGKDLGLTASEVGLAITQSMVLSAIVQYGVLNCAQLNYLLVSIRRILEYNAIPQEDDPVNPILPPPTWPENGRIVLKNVNLKYSLCKPRVLKNLNLLIEPREKVGIVGRTGAGKSSLLSALFRLVKVDGIIEIDGFNTGDLPLKLFVLSYL